MDNLKGTKSVEDAEKLLKKLIKQLEIRLEKTELAEEEAFLIRKKLQELRNN